MSRSASIRIVSLALAICAFPLLTGGAWAYFSTSGAGDSTPAAVKTLSAPTISAATPGAGTVTLTWGAVTAPGTGAVTYYVTRDGEEVEGNCPEASSPESVTTCIDSNVPIGTHSYKVTARWRSWSATSSPSSAKVTVGAAVRFTVVAASATPGVGVADNLTITALDASGNTVTPYTGSHSLTFSGAEKSPSGTSPTVVSSGGTATNFGAATAITFTNGIATVTSSKNGVMKLYRAGATSITVSDGSISNTTPLLVTVAPGSATKLFLAAATTTPTAGVVDNLTTTALDTYGNTATTYTGSHNVTFSGASSSPNGTAPSITSSAGTATAFGVAMPIVFSAGVATVSAGGNGAMTLYKSGATSVTANDGTISASALALTVAAAPAAQFSLAAASKTPAAGATDNLTTTALDTYGNTATTYTGSHNVTFSGASSSPSATVPTVVDSGGTATNFGAATAITFTNGIATVASSKNGVMKLYDAETAAISVNDGAISTTSALSVTVAATTASRLAFANVTISAGSLSSLCLFTCTATGLGNSGAFAANVIVTDAYGNLNSTVGTGHTVSVTQVGGGVISGGSLTIASTGPAESTTRFTYTAKVSGAYTDKITAAKSAGTAYTSATAETSR